MTSTAETLLSVLVRDGSRRDPWRGCSWEAIGELCALGYAELDTRHNVEILRPTAAGRALYDRGKTWPPA